MSRRFQFSLRGLLVATTLAVALGFWCQSIRPQIAAIATIKGKGGSLIYRHQGGGTGTYPDAPDWLRLFDGYWVEEVLLRGKEFSDDDLLTLAVFPRPKVIGYCEDTNVTPAGIGLLRRRLPHCFIGFVD